MKITKKLNIDKVLFVARKFAILTNPDRIKLIYLMLDTPGLNVTQIKNLMNLTLPQTSFHLTWMKYYGLLSSKRLGKSSYYSVNTDELEKILKYTEELAKKD